VADEIVLPATRVCKRCGNERTLAQFTKNAHLKDGIDSKCRQCVSDVAAERNARNSRRLADGYVPYPDGMKLCPECNQAKPVSEFYNRSSRKDGLDRICKPCRLRQVREYTAGHINQRRESLRRYIERHPEQRRATVERYDKGHRSEKGKYLKQWRKSNREKYLAWNRVYKKHHYAIKKAATVGSAADIKAFYKMVERADRIRCYWCAKLVPKKRQVDPAKARWAAFRGEYVLCMFVVQRLEKCTNAP